MIEELIKKLELSNSKLLKMSFTHSSFLNENFSNTDLESNERLEFLGDSVISYIVAEYIYEKYPNLTEGDMSKIRSLVVQRSSLANLAKNLDLQQHMILGKGEEKNNGRIKESNLCDLFESFIGCCTLALGIVSPESGILSGDVNDYKLLLHTTILAFLSRSNYVLIE